MEKYFDYIIFGLAVTALVGFLVIGFWYLNAGPGVEMYNNINEWIIEQLRNL